MTPSPSRQPLPFRAMAPFVDRQAQARRVEEAQRVSVRAEKILEALLTGSDLDGYLMQHGSQAAIESLRQLAQTAAERADNDHFAMVRCHPKAYGNINHVSTIVFKRLENGNYEARVAHHECIPIRPRPHVEDGAITSSAGLCCDRYDTREEFEALTGQRVPLPKLPMFANALKHGVPAANIVACPEPDRAFDYIDLQVRRTRHFLEARKFIREGLPASEHRPDDGVPVYGFAPRPGGAASQGHAFYPKGDGSSAQSQSNNCFAYVAGVLGQDGAGTMPPLDPAMPTVPLALDFFSRGLVAHLPVDARRAGETRGIHDTEGVDAFKFYASNWGTPDVWQQHGLPSAEWHFAPTPLPTLARL